MAGLHIDITADNQGAMKAIEDVQNRIHTAAKDIKQSGMDIDKVFKMVGGAIGTYFAVGQLQNFASEVINVRKEMQSLQISFATLLGSKAKGDSMFSELKEFAVTTPLMLKDLASGAQTMLGFNIEAEKVIPTLKQIGDISMGDSQKFQSLTLAFSQMSATGKLMGQDLLQMINAGFNPLIEISRKTGKSIGELKDEMSNGAISTEMVADAFKSATSEGGQFYGMLEKQGQGLAGQINTLKGAIDDMMNTLGEQSEGAISGVVGALTEIVKNYEKVGTILMGLIGTYGAYHAAVFLTIAAQNGYTVATYAAEAAQAALNATMLANPFVAAAVALGALVTACIAFGDGAKTAADAQKEYNEAQAEAAKKEAEHKRKIEELLSVVKDDAKSQYERQMALSALRKAYPSIFKQYDTESIKLADLIKLKERIEELDNKKANAKNANLNKNINDAKNEEKRLIQGNNSETTKKIDAARMTTNLLLNKRAKQVQEEYIAELSKLSKDDLKRYASELRKRAKGVGDTDFVRMMLPTKDGKLSDEIALTGEELKNLIEVTEQKRNPPKKSDPTKNKKFWEDKKKEAQDALDALGDIEATGKKGDELRKKILDYDKKLEAYKASTNTKQEKATAKEVKQDALDAERLNELQRNQALQREREAKDLELKTTQSRINAMAEGGSKILAQAEQNFKQEREQIKREQEDLLKQREDSAKALWEAQNAEAKRNGTTWESSGAAATFRANNKLTDEDKEYFKAREEEASASYQRIITEQAKLETDAIREYLRIYGTFQEQRYAIAQDYNEKIAKAQTDAKKSVLEAQKQSELSILNAQNLASGIDWSNLVGNVGGIVRSVAQETLERIDEYMRTDEFKKLSATDKKAYTELRSNVYNSLGSNGTSAFSFGVWGDIEKMTKDYQTKVGNLAEATKKHTDAVVKLEEAEKHLEEATDDTSKEIAKMVVNIAKKEVQNTANAQNEAQAEVTDAQTNLTQTTENANQGLQAFANSMREISSGSLFGFANGIAGLIQSLSGASRKTDSAGNALAEIGGKAGGLVGAILQIIDALGDDPTQFIYGILEKVANVVETILSDLPNLIVKVLEGVWDIIKGIGQGFANMFTASGNSVEVKHTTEELTASNKVLASRLADLTDVIGNSAGEKAIYAYKAALEAQKNIVANNKRILEENMHEWGRNHSNAYYADNKHISQFNNKAQDAFRAAGVKGATINSIESVLALTPEQLKAIKDFLPELWEYVTTVGKNDKAEFWEAVVEEAGKAERLTEQIRDNLTQTSFDSLRSSFLDTLTNMDSNAADFAQNFEQMMYKAIVNALVLDDEFDEWLKQWQARFADAVEKGNTQALDALEQESIKKREELISKSDSYAEAMGYHRSSTGATATINAVQGITEDTANDIVGRMTNLQIIGEVNRGSLMQMVSSMNDISSLMESGNSIAEDMRSLMVLNNSYLEDIAKYNKAMYVEWTDKLNRLVNKFDSL